MKTVTFPLNKRKITVTDQIRRIPNGIQLTPLFSLKGGNPSTASATDALLRLRPCRRSYRGPPKGTSGITDSLDVTGSVYKTRERIHRAMADTRLLAIPAS